MFPNLLGQKAIHHLTDDDMANIIGISRTAYQSKKKSGRFTPAECQASGRECSERDPSCCRPGCV